MPTRSLLTILLTLIGIAALSAACAPTPPAATPTPQPPPAPTVPSAPKPAASATPPAASSPIPLPATAAPAAGKVKIRYTANAMAELISPEGTRVLIDIYSPPALSAPPTAADLLLTTHTHNDHINRDFLASFPGQQLFVKTGALQAPGVKITGIAAAHNAGDAPQPEGGTDYIFLIEMGGLHIAHFGDIGQEALSAGQLAALGKVDIAFMQFENSYSAMDTTNKKGFNMMQQLKPRLIIPTHVNQSGVKLLGETWSSLYSEKAFIAVGDADLGSQTRVIFLGSRAKAWADVTKAALAEW